MAGCWVGIATGLWPLSGPKSGYRGCQGAADWPVGPKGSSIRREAEAKGRAFRFLCVRAPTADGWRGPPFFTCIRRWGYISQSRVYLLSASGNLQLWLPRRGGSSSRQAGTQRRCSRPLLRQQPAAATKIKTAAAKMETSAPSSSGAPQTRRPGAR